MSQSIGTEGKNEAPPPQWRGADGSRLEGFTGRRFAPHRWFVSLAKLLTRGRSYEVFRGLSYSRRAFRPYVAFNARLMPFGKLPRRDTELLILRVAWVCGSLYEWHQHLPFGRSAGLGETDIERIKVGPGADGLGDRDRTLLTACEELLTEHVISGGTWAALRPLLDDAQIVELCMLVGNYAMLAGTLNSLGVQLEAPLARRLT